MRQATALLLVVLATQTYSAEFITWKDGKLGVNFGGYHAGVGWGGPGGTGGGLYAQAGTPHGQSAMAGLGGAFGTKGGGSTGGLFAGATAGGNLQASAGLGGLAAENGFATGNGFAAAQAGNQVASTGLGGQSAAAGSTGYKFSGTQSFAIPSTAVKETVVSVENKPETEKKIHKVLNLEATNEVNPLPLASDAHIDAKIDVKANAQPVLVKEVYAEPQPYVVQKTKIRTHYKPHRHHIHKTAYIGGYVDGGAEIPPPPLPSFQQAQKRVDIDIGGSGNIGVIDATHGQGGHTIRKEVTAEKNPTFFQDIFNIPISTLQAVGSFLSNSAANTKVSVQKSVQAETDSSSKHVPSPSSSSSDSHISVETPSVSQIIDGIFAIPINTLGAVNKFLENNVSARKRIQVEAETGEPTRVRLGPHARRRANKQVIVIQQDKSDTPMQNEAQ